MVAEPTAGMSFKGFAPPRASEGAARNHSRLSQRISQEDLIIITNRDSAALPAGVGPMEVTRLNREDVGGVRDATREDARAPRILCWNCKKLTPFQEERCTHCGARFAGSTGGMYAKSRTVSPRVPPAPANDAELVEARRSLLQLFEDLQRVHDVSAAHRYDSARDEETITLFQCPSCGRFVSEDAAECACGVRFAPEAGAPCPRCGTSLAAGSGTCPVCARAEQIAYACPVCGVEVSEDAVQCSCGARFA